MCRGTGNKWGDEMKHSRWSFSVEGIRENGMVLALFFSELFIFFFLAKINNTFSNDYFISTRMFVSLWFHIFYFIY